MNATKQFHQFLIKEKNRHKFMIISYKKKFNVIFMKYKSFGFYVQNKMN